MTELEELPRTNRTAVKRGFMWFYTGKPCVNGHLAKRYTKGGTCSECLRAKCKSPRSAKELSPENAALARGALENGHNVFTAVKPCLRGHIERWASSGNCVECNKISMAKRKSKNRENRLVALYGLSEQDFAELHWKQNEACAICKERNETAFRMHVDHCHTTGKVRGLLCSRCNQGLGLFRENPDIFLAALEYLNNAS